RIRRDDQSDVGCWNLHGPATYSQGTAMSLFTTTSQSPATDAFTSDSKGPRGNSSIREVSIAHSPDSDDAFMFYALATNKVRASGIRLRPTLGEFETLNGKPLRGEGIIMVTATSFKGFLTFKITMQRFQAAAWLVIDLGP